MPVIIKPMLPRRWGAGAKLQKHLNQIIQMIETTTCAKATRQQPPRLHVKVNKSTDIFITIHPKCPQPFSIPHICHFFTQAKFFENKIYTEKRQFLPIFRQFLPIYTEICTKKRQFLPIFANFSR